MKQPYTVHFVGMYPVGAVAIVAAESEEDVKVKFLAHLKVNYPELYKNNLEPCDLVIEPLTLCTDHDVNVILDGDY